MQLASVNRYFFISETNQMRYNLEMKKQAIIPLFIPHMGCPHDCVFCNQNTITASDAHMDSTEIKKIMDARLKSLAPIGLELIEAAFYGGSFTGLPIETQQELLAAVIPYKKEGRIQKIRLSTRPDYITTEILDMLRLYSVDIIELGAQSFDNDVLTLSSRGHNVAQTVNACEQILKHKFSLGVQLMVGLPGDTYEKSVHSATMAVEMKPDFVRIYPTVILRGSALAGLYQEGSFLPFTQEETIETVISMVKIFDEHHIPVIRIGLKSTNNISASTDLSGNYHPAFRQLVESRMAYEDISKQLKKSNFVSGNIMISTHPRSFSNMIGQNAENKKMFRAEYPQLYINYKSDSTVPEKTYVITTKNVK